jgi:dihydrofolate reductase
VRISLIVAFDEHRGIGRQGGLPWRLSADLQRFKILTMGHHILMGRRTWESIGRPLPGRTNVVITRQLDYSAPGCVVVDSLAAGLDIARRAQEDEAFVIGGGEIYQAALASADRIYLTRVHAHITDADVHFPEIDLQNWELIYKKNFPKDAKNEHPTTYQIWDRI